MCADCPQRSAALFPRSRPASASAPLVLCSASTSSQHSSSKVAMLASTVPAATALADGKSSDAGFRVAEQRDDARHVRSLSAGAISCLSSPGVNATHVTTGGLRTRRADVVASRMSNAPARRVGLQCSAKASINPCRALTPPVPVRAGSSREAKLARSLRLRELLNNHHLAEHPVSGDGSCQFRALSHQLFGTDMRHREVRSKVIEQLCGAEDRYAGFVLGSFKRYVDRMRVSGTWGDNVTLQAAADTYARPVVVLSDYEHDARKVLLPVGPNCVAGCEKAPLCMTFHAEVHYNSTRPQSREFDNSNSIFSVGSVRSHHRDVH